VFRSLNQHWRTWIAARERYRAIELRVTLVYGDEDWSEPSEREANARAIPAVETIVLDRCGHFASLDRPERVAEADRRARQPPLIAAMISTRERASSGVSRSARVRST
jgi:pimeloyl-ACP methyl ester carboxylesterase